MKINLTRIYQCSDYTIGKLYINGSYFCDTIEDTVRDLSTEPKVYGKTAIPQGTYQVIVNRSPKFGRELPRLVGVPYFDGVLIHRGNTAEDTSGCIIVGLNEVKGKVINSTPYEVALTSKIKEAIRNRETVTISVINQ